MMEIDRQLLRLAFVMVACLSVFGCYRKPIDSSESNRSEVQNRPEVESPPQPPRPIDHLAAARRLFKVRSLEAAADAANKALLQDPESVEATLVASEIEAARGNHRVAVDLASSIDVGSRLGKKAVDIHSQQLAALGRNSEAADVLLGALQVMPEVAAWRHKAWELLSRVGRREEASLQAELLSRMGLATEQELLSLVRRTESYPPVLREDQDPNEFFDPGLGLARWYFTKQKYAQALNQLAPQNAKAGFQSTAEAALYGRLLAETQAFEEIPSWHSKCDLEQARQLGDYWAALGTYFFDQRQYEASAKALLEAVTRNPTDRICFQRLSKVFGALGREDEGLAFRNRAVKISDSERTAESILIAGMSGELQKMLTRQVMDLGRPFETLQWTSAMLPSGARAQRDVVDQQRASLLQSQRALTMASESSLLGIDPSQFDIEPAIDALVSAAGTVTPRSEPIDVDLLATPRLVNVAEEKGIKFQWYQDLEINIASIPIHESVGGGIAVLDFDLDGWPDVYLGQGSGEPPTNQCTRSNELFRNVDSRFVDVTSLSGTVDFNYSAGIAAGDVNQDGFPDLYLGSLGRNRLLINNGDGTFREVTDRLGSVEDQFTSSLAIADINGDSLPDLFEAIYIEMEGAFKLPDLGDDGQEIQPSPLFHYAQSDRWFQNRGDGTFQLRVITREVAKPGTSLGVVVTDFDSDGSNEVFVGNDVRPNHLLVQRSNNQFVNTADAMGLANGFHGAANGCMGIASGDFNRDGLLDLHITNFNEESANLFIHTSGGGFTDLAVRYGVEEVSWPYVGFGTKANDLDRNGWLDLLVTNGHIFDMRRYGEEFQMPPQCLMGRGRRFELTHVDDDSGYWDKLYLGRTMAMLDFDRNGSVDFLVNHLDHPLALLENQTESPGAWIQLELVGTTSERDAVGTRVVVTCGADQFTQWVTGGDGYFCSDEAMIDMGLGTGRQVDHLEVTWPSGTVQKFEKLEARHRYLIVEDAGQPYLRD